MRMVLFLFLVQQKKLVVDFNTAKVKFFKYISMYLELHQTIVYHQTITRQLFKKEILSIPPNITTTNIPGYTVQVYRHIDIVYIHSSQLLQANPFSAGDSSQQVKFSEFIGKLTEVP